MVIGAAGLVADRFIFQDAVPAPAEAATVIEHTASSTDISSIAIPEMPFPHGIEPLHTGAEIHDLFAPPFLRSSHSRRADGADNHRRRASNNTRSEDMNAEAFATQHHLNAVLLNDGLRIAIIDGHWLQVGQSVDGCTLRSITGRDVRFECYDDSATLKIGGTEIIPVD